MAGQPGGGAVGSGFVISPDVASRLIFDLSDIDLRSHIADRAQIETVNPHRGHMGLLDEIVWKADDGSSGVALNRVREDEFWVAGHFPGRPMYPGVMQIEAGAQLACYLYNSRKPYTTLAAFLRIEDASFRSMVFPGDDLYILCKDVKFGRRQFICDVQGMVGGERIAFDARIRGMQIDDNSPD